MTATPETATNRGVQRLHAAFARAEAEGRAAFIPFMTGGYPDAARFGEVAGDLLARADIMEVGIPYSDPLGDGPTIQRASEQALAGGTSTRRTLELVRELRQKDDTPIVIMTYINPIYAVGPAEFMRLAQEAGVDGLILPDLPPDQDLEIADLAAQHGLAVTFLIAPTSTPERVKLVAEACTGFLYAVSVTGVTGAREGAALGEVPRMLDLARQYAQRPVVVGFGVKDAATAQQVAQVADGVVVGSAFINAVAAGRDVGALADELAAGCRR
ncbi:tryptophan synthase subunit alpha [Deinococcus radiodurans]|jgi:tryptophan synthase, alpha chain (EC 4.2.1.20)|uniref:Tryptophan synthase alpha chain n=1 Tax=Deinococcus radiodurans (strain ATCC 13939 / DSM 20539 / JCM 16871 / CCUG 27074 / LMG 4051 / NBRC 15346 / NCIMB 9279 / VKM B-1422 / R1) TaxID=243230 RepID=TRPA_DEIRA|nr:tryptophan synthase subunit alpha [Deinococcus radiodurans]Q9RVT0.1 RecName: Full=Tryptophan synthase alpha chain [Deinococcus radiodurans R1 = ATCC 13939 = DSM 20539]AAF10519.1 tryptophan synthase, alpha subunit [Deinococcus radiodurans R1 = ATCC 13939 = DSM 20539]ANC71865.1 tryptophan synthase subunit alpha [Deinococcus radiodurans R1 = ATCC 13939 = DSM 20539]QEM70438.1 tryptophan synthase subunit alpha [Deinococcus radiodurans]QIP29050.1 tryptophan synthase subunit alpha [Deinococcus rad